MGFFVVVAATWRGGLSWLPLEAEEEAAVVVSKLALEEKVVVVGLLRCCFDLGGRDGPLRPPNS